MRQRTRPSLIPGAPILGYGEHGIPVVPVTIEVNHGNYQFILKTCPYCGKDHVHGGGRFRGDDPIEHQGHRWAHCLDRKPGNRGYILRIVDEAE